MPLSPHVDTSTDAAFRRSLEEQNGAAGAWLLVILEALAALSIAAVVVDDFANRAEHNGWPPPWTVRPLILPLVVTSRCLLHRRRRGQDED